MNLTSIATTTNSNWKRAKAHYVALAAGVALAASAVLALPGASTPTSTVSAPSVTRAVVPATPGDRVPHHYFYIVGSDAEARALQAADFELISAAGASQRDPNVHVEVLVAGSQATLALQRAGTQELDEAGTRYTIIDSTEATKSSVASLSANESDIAASVLSTERANHDFRTVESRPQAARFESIEEYAAREQAILETLPAPTPVASVF
jgi:hypothetical protein